MPFDYSGNWVKLPKVGDEPVRVKIISVKRVESPGHKSNFKSLEKDYGFHYQVTCADDAKFDLGTWALFYAFKEQDVQEGDEIIISHPTRGSWKVKRVMNEKIARKGNDLDYLTEIEKRQKQKSTDSQDFWDE